MHFKKKKNYLSLYQSTVCIYHGELIDLPFRPDVIKNKSDQFFNDPNPCEIHRTAVILRLCAELEELLAQKKSDSFLQLLGVWCEFTNITDYAYDA